ncbi:MAG: FKBP-type peptidyl-prolyl cis-trans isomerase [Idiomarina sp.]
MNKIYKPFALSAVAFALVACTPSEPYPTSTVTLEQEEQKEAYALGASVGRFIDRQLDAQEEAELMLERDVVIAGFVDALKGEAKLSEAEAEEILNVLRERVVEQRQQVIGGKAQAQGEEYLAENAKKEGVTVTESGLQYEVLEQGDGEKPAETDMVEVHYEGTLVNGEVFDSSIERGEPAVFPLNRVIPGWTEGVQLMSVGSKYRFVIPSELAYGDREVGGGQIPPNSTLIFEVELMDIKNPETMDSGE